MRDRLGDVPGNVEDPFSDLYNDDEYLTPAQAVAEWRVGIGAHGGRVVPFPVHLSQWDQLTRDEFDAFGLPAAAFPATVIDAHYGRGAIGRAPDYTDGATSYYLAPISILNDARRNGWNAGAVNLAPEGATAGAHQWGNWLLGAALFVIAFVPHRHQRRR